MKNRINEFKEQLSKDKLKEYLDSDKSLNDISKETGISSYYLSRLSVEYELMTQEDLKARLKRINSMKLAERNKANTGRKKSQEEIEKFRKSIKETYSDLNRKNEIIKKHHETSLKNNGYISCFSDPKIQNKIKETNLEKYGKKYYFQTDEFKEKMRETMRERYNSDNAMHNNILIDKQIKTVQNKYGVSNVLSSKEIQEKIKNTNLEKYGVEYACLLDQCREANGKIISNINKKFSELLNKNEIDNSFEFRIGNCNYDIKIENLNILIELNPTYTHNSTIGPVFVNKTEISPISSKYHFNKTKLAQENGYHCIHIFDWDDWNKIINLINPNKEKIFARKCEVKEVDKQECKEFLNKHHLQGTCQHQDIRLGLYYNNKLVQLMTFGKPRYNKNYQYELLRLSSSDKQVTGGSGRLFKYFINNYNPKSIISYCDNSKFNGEVYKKLGFELKDYGKPTCHWFDGKNHITDNLLRQRGFDQLFGTNYGKGTSNRDLMIQAGYVEVYDCGQSVWTWNKN